MDESGRRRSLVEDQIQTAIANGAFDDLPGKGRPLRLPARDDENWWVRAKLQREGIPTDALLPTPLALRREVERLPETVRDLPDEDAVRAVVADLNQRIVRFLRTPSGPRVPLGRVAVDDVVAGWAAARAERAERLARQRAQRDDTRATAAPAPARRRWTPWWRRP